jgi:hypothetical protein
MTGLLPDPSLTLVYRLEAVLGEPLNLGEVSQGVDASSRSPAACSRDPS